MSETTFRSFEEFWPFYVREHSSKLNRALHFVGTSAAMASVARAILARKPGYLLAAPLVGYGFAWVGHFLVEKNRPATFKHPLWSLRGDFRMWRHIVMGTMAAEVEKATQAEVAPEKSNGARAGAATAAPDPQMVN
jgi:hypothetical protein